MPHVEHIIVPYENDRGMEIEEVRESYTISEALVNLTWLFESAHPSHINGEFERVILSAAGLIAHGATPAQALGTAIIWERG